LISITVAIFILLIDTNLDHQLAQVISHCASGQHPNIRKIIQDLLRFLQSPPLHGRCCN
jgi:hypothetical protein